MTDYSCPVMWKKDRLLWAAEYDVLLDKLLHSSSRTLNTCLVYFLTAPGRCTVTATSTLHKLICVVINNIIVIYNTVNYELQTTEEETGETLVYAELANSGLRRPHDNQLSSTVPRSNQNTGIEPVYTVIDHTILPCRPTTPSNSENTAWQSETVWLW